MMPVLLEPLDPPPGREVRQAGAVGQLLGAEPGVVLQQPQQTLVEVVQRLHEVQKYLEMTV